MFNFTSITERDMDFLIMGLFAEGSKATECFLNQAGLEGSKIINIVHSLSDAKYGESDIEVFVEKDDKRYAILIEDKIDAAAMPEQSMRYSLRGDSGIANGDYHDHSVFIVAPMTYLEKNEEAKKYQYQVSYETLLSIRKTEKSVRSSFDCAIIEAALLRKETGYQVEEVPAITCFWNELYNYCCSYHPNVEMHKPRGAKGSKSGWPYFKTALKGTTIIFKSNSGAVDFEFSGKHKQSKQIKQDLALYLVPDMNWVDTGKSISLRIRVPKVDFNEPFNKYSHKMPEVFYAIERFTILAQTLCNTGFSIPNTKE